MKKLFSKLALAVLGLATIGGVVTAKDSTSPVKVEAESHSNIIRIYLDCSWTITNVTINSQTAKLTASNPEEYVASHGKYVADLTSTSQLTQITGPSFKEGTTTWHPTLPNTKNWDLNAGIKHTFIPGYQYRIHGINWSYEYGNMEHKWYTYTVTDLGQIPEKVVKHTITFMDGTTKKGTEEYDDAAEFTGKLYKKEGHRFVGWFKDSGFETEFKKGDLVTDDMTLYAKYEKAEDFTIKLASKPWTTLYAYMFSNQDGHFNQEWPGVQMTTLSITIDASESYDYIIFAEKKDNGRQTVDLKLEYVSGTYTIASTPIVSSDGDNGKYKATFKVDPQVEANEFIAKWTAMRQSGNKGICDYDLKGTNELTELLKEFKTLDSEVQAIVKEATDVGSGDNGFPDTTIGATMEYIENVLSLDATSLDEPTATNGIVLLTENKPVSLIALFAILGLVAISAYYFIEKKRLAK